MKRAWFFGGIAFLWFLTMSGWLGVVPGAEMSRRPNVLFNSDVSRSIQRLADPTPPSLQAHRYFVHLFEPFVWRPLCRTAVRAFELVMPFERARLLAPRSLVALVAAIGVTALAWLALSRGLHPIHTAVLFIVYLLFTSNVLVAVPENEGLSSGLLTVNFALWSVLTPSRRRTVVLGLMAVAAAGTTISNGLFGAVCLAYDRLRSPLRAAGAGLLAVVALGSVTLLLTQVSVSVDRFAELFMNGRLLHAPFAAITYAGWSVVAPAIGPSPHVAYLDAKIVSFEPFELWRYSGLAAVGAVAWLLLFGVTTARALQDAETRVSALILLSWVSFNAIFHNVWGDEFFLYAPHWAWALMALVMLGARRLRPRWVVIAGMVLVPGQLHTLIAIRTALHSLTE